MEWQIYFWLLLTVSLHFRKGLMQTPLFASPPCELITANRLDVLHLTTCVPPLRAFFIQAAAQLGPDAAWRLFLNVQQCIARQQQSQQTSVSGGGASGMTAGPLFLKMARERWVVIVV
eukprot:1162113-Pelagomonas_calceolata.AAC.20